MKETLGYRVQYGIAPSRTTSLGQWMLAVTGVVALLAWYGTTAGWFGPRPPADLPAATDLPQPPPATPPAGSGNPQSLPPPDPGAETEILSYFPLDAGHRWDFAQEVQVPGAPPRADRGMSFEVTAVDWNHDRATWACRLGEETLYYYIAGDDLIAARAPASPGLVQLRSPLTQGATWEDPPGKLRWRVERTSVPVTLSLGTFSCLELQKEPLSGDGGLETLFYAPGVGLVKQITLEPSGARRTYTLVSYAVGGTQVPQPSD